MSQLLVPARVDRYRIRFENLSLGIEIDVANSLHMSRNALGLKPPFDMRCRKSSRIWLVDQLQLSNNGNTSHSAENEEDRASYGDYRSAVSFHYD